MLFLLFYHLYYYIIYFIVNFYKFKFGYYNTNYFLIIEFSDTELRKCFNLIFYSSIIFLFYSGSFIELIIDNK